MLGPLTPIPSFVHASLAGDIPDTALETMRLCALDWAYCGLAVADEDSGIPVAMADYARHCGAGPASVFWTSNVIQHGGAHRLAARDAALINGTLGHALDVDDTHFAHIGHVSTVVLPAAMAVAEMKGRSFDDVIMAARIGAEVAVRVGLWLGRSHYQAGWHQTATSGAYGAAVAATCLLAEDAVEPKVTSAILNVAGMAGGLKAQFGSPMKPVNAGLAASQGVEAAFLAHSGQGLSGSTDVLDAVLATQAGEGNADAFDTLGQAWLFDTVSHKYHACCHGTHAMLEALTALNLPRSAQVDRIDITTHPRWMTVCNKPAPTTWLEGKFSYRFLAAMYLDGQDSFGAGPTLYFPIPPHVQSTMDRTNVAADETMAETSCAVAVTLRDGTRHDGFYDLQRPETLDQRRDRLVQKGRALLHPTLAQEVAAAVSARDMAAFTRAIRQTA
ncbi:MmgE/PrpD family protein [Pseudooctadecabacter jejudonensis]|uniref:MmgE/PrpD family protein n=1 Tax=Pseudooctadecabacter jejudonensis TaxID=1391910 RepID=A0A1Y5REP0_9RHOB|nr:MmgE/PrpD family protein [Pseudooctadecabacter jejudonensis]SLN15731.1 MmgE/PrpD family protein [Pseudooctadecabacter jejudonensis]